MNKQSAVNKRQSEEVNVMRTVVIGDVHGCYRELKRLVSRLEENKAYEPGRDRLIFLGDYIDRGENPRRVIRFIRDLQERYGNVIALMGNHEDMLLEWLDGEGRSWEYNGCEATIRSYKGYMADFQDDCRWMRDLPLYYEDDHYIYVHAGIDPEIPMEEQDKETLLWIRDEFIDNPVKAEKVVVFGHTPGYGQPYQTPAGNICLDIGCVFYGSLTAMVIGEDGEKTFCGSQGALSG